MKRRSVLFGCFVTVVFLATNSYAVSKQFIYGSNNYAQGVITFSANTSYTSTKATGSIGAEAYAYLFKTNIPIASATAAASSVKGGSSSCLVDVKLRGYSVNGFPYQKQSELSWSGTYPKTLATPTLTFPVYGVPVSIDASVSGTAVPALTLKASIYDISAIGSLRLYSTGSASARLGNKIVSAGLRASLKFIDDTLSSQIKTSFTKTSANAVWIKDPITLYLYLVAKVYGFPEWSKEIASWSRGSRETYKLL